ncbi:MAG TPA: hemerythrin domain-containing protein [Rudaea sp.]
MVFDLKRWFGQRAPAPAERPQRGEYRPDLIAALREDHRELLALFTELDRASRRGDEAACRAALDRFTRVLQEHLLTENRHLYGYFSRHADPDPEVAQRIETMSAQMMNVGKILHRFITTYSRSTWTAALHDRLREDIRTIGQVLTHRIHEEESVLYPLYVPRSS